MADLKKFFTDEQLSANKCTAFSENYEEALALEAQSVAIGSPGVVLNSETVARQIFSPIHYDEDKNEIVAAAFSDVKDKGLSVNRLQHSSESIIHEAGIAKAERDRERRPDREYIGFCMAEVGNIRSIEEAGTQIFTVYDSALPQANHHADVCQVIFGVGATTLPKKVADMNRRAELQAVFSNFVKFKLFQHVER
ncbi:MAG: hypothetical protein E6470_09525 [Enterobacteriaceae bacterium]|nr:hypothetical protein [Enterobacteriaceae bacterium]